jgi:hypothetical protein
MQIDMEKQKLLTRLDFRNNWPLWVSFGITLYLLGGAKDSKAEALASAGIYFVFWVLFYLAMLPITHWTSRRKSLFWTMRVNVLYSLLLLILAFNFMIYYTLAFLLPD